MRISQITIMIVFIFVSDSVLSKEVNCFNPLLTKPVDELTTEVKVILENICNLSSDISNFQTLYDGRTGAWEDASTAFASGAGGPQPTDGFALTSPYNTPYQVLATGGPASARFRVPASHLVGLTIGAPNAFVAMDGADAIVSVLVYRRPSHSRVQFVRSFRSEVLDEEVR